MHIYKGFSERKVAKLFQLLARIATEENKGAEVFLGHPVLEVNLRLSYQSSGIIWWKDKYYYVSRNRFAPTFLP